MAKILFWNPSGGQVGHCSLMLDDETYISFWPAEPYGFTAAYRNVTVSSTPSSYKNDRLNEGNRDPDRTILIKGKLDNAAIHTWWMNNQSCGYSVSNNCSTMVDKALEAGKLEPKELKELQKITAKWRDEVSEKLTGGGIKHQKVLKRLEK